MTNIIEVDFMTPEKKLEYIKNEELNRYGEQELIAVIGDTSVYANERYAIVKVDNKIKLSFLRGNGDLKKIVDILEKLIK